jgi:hypothetical protein
MDDASLTRQLARLMGWEVVAATAPLPSSCEPQVCFDSVYQCWFYRAGTTWKHWNPLKDLSDAWMVVEHMQKEGYDYEIGSCIYSDEDGNPIEGHSAEFMRGLLDPYEGTHEETHGAIAATPARAICLAALPKEGG